jgi:hypothetical protein
MTEQELRALVRDAVARHLGASAATPAHPGTRAPGHLISLAHHSSHQLFAVPAGADTDGPCVIEPAVACNHCGYCKSYGH